MLELKEATFFSHPKTWPDFDIHIGAFTVIEASESAPVIIGSKSRIGHNVVVSGGVTLGESVSLDSMSFVGGGTIIGDGSEIHSAKVFREVRIGRNSFIGGEVSNWTVIGDDVTFMGRIVHTYRHPGDAENWRHSPPQPSPKIGDRSVIGENALLIGGINIGIGAYVAAGEIVKFHVPDGHIAIAGKVIPLTAFRGFIQSRR
jgi:acetyltransferase-like isoleucine patch superfamily enzyme